MSRGWLAILGVGLMVVAAVLLLSPFASSDPDGLEAVAESAGFGQRAEAAPYSLIPDYTIEGLPEAVSTIASGALGAAMVLGLVIAVAWMLRRRAPGGA